MSLTVEPRLTQKARMAVDRAAAADEELGAMASHTGEAVAALDDLAVLHLASDAARRAILPWFRRRDLSIDDKDAARFDPVTEADRAGERAIRAVLARFRPEDGVLGEEYPPIESRSGRVWTLDPIDGTRAFITGLAHWGVLIALSEGDRAILGVLDQPFLRERFVGGVGGAPVARLERDGAAPEALGVRGCAALKDAILFSTAPEIFAPGPEREAFERAAAAMRLTRYGADCYGYAMVAAGHADLVIEAGLGAYDIRALIPIIEAAGGVVTDWRGGSAHDGGQVIAAGDGRIHAEALALLRG